MEFLASDYLWCCTHGLTFEEQFLKPCNTLSYAVTREGSRKPTAFRLQVLWERGIVMGTGAAPKYTHSRSHLPIWSLSYRERTSMQQVRWTIGVDKKNSSLQAYALTLSSSTTRSLHHLHNPTCPEERRAKENMWLSGLLWQETGPTRYDSFHGSAPTVDHVWVEEERWLKCSKVDRIVMDSDHLGLGLCIGVKPVDMRRPAKGSVAGRTLNRRPSWRSWSVWTGKQSLREELQLETNMEWLTICARFSLENSSVFWTTMHLVSSTPLLSRSDTGGGKTMDWS